MSLFITLEGVEGAGKSTLAKSLKKELESQGKEVVLTFEPGDCSIGKKIREILLKEKLNSSAELFLFLADRAQHIEEVIKPALAQGKIVICDRFTHSTIAYQGDGRGLDKEQLNYLNKIAVQSTRPDLVLLIDLDPEIGLKRVIKRGEELSSFDSEKLEFHRKVKESFLNQAKNEPEIFCIIDGCKSPEEILRISTETITSRL